MANANRKDQNRIVVVGAHAYTQQTNCPIASGDVGIWLDSTGTFFQRNADTTDVRLTVEAQGPLYVALTKTATALANTPTYSNGTAGVGATLTASSSAAIGTVGGVAVSTVGSVILVDQQASTFQNGLYVVTVVGSGSAAWKLTRLPGYDTAATIVDGTIVAVQQGTYADLIYSQSATVTTVGTDAVTFGLSATAVTYAAVVSAIAGSTGSASVDFSGSTGTFKTTTGTNTIGGATVFAANKGVTVSAGTSAFDFSGGTGIFATSTGLNTIGGDLLMSAGKVVGFGAPQALSGAGAVNVTTLVTNFTSTGNAQALTLADGTRAGQLKILHHTVDGGSGVMTPATAGNFATFTLTNVHDAALFQWTGSVWNIVLNVGGTVA